MRRLYVFGLVLLFLPVANNAIAQNRCEEFPSLTDSAHHYLWNAVDSTWLLETIQVYAYNSSGRVTGFESYDAKTRTPKTRRDYYYSNEGKLLETISFKYVEGIWVNVQNVIYSSFAGETDRYETVYNWVSNEWKLQSRTINHYENDKRVGYTAQLINKTTQNFYDYGYYYITYNEYDNIDEWYGIKVSDGSLLFNRKYFYDENKNLYERHIFSPSGGQLVLSSRNLYYRNEFGLNHLTINQRLSAEGEWYTTEKYEYFHKINTASKAFICHKLKTICVDQSAVPGFLLQGATLGRCPRVSPSGTALATRESSATPVTSVSVYPNPASDVVNITGLTPEVKRIDIYTASGALVHTISIVNKERVTFNRNNLAPGVYFLNITGDMEPENFQVILR